MYRIRGLLPTRGRMGGVLRRAWGIEAVWMWRVMRWVYSIGFTCLLPWIFFRLWLRSAKFPAYNRRWLERLGWVPLPPLEEVLWVHAVSMGEAVSAIPLVHRLRSQDPTVPILVTTTTPTGSERVQTAFKDALGKHIYHCYLPYDVPLAWNTFFSRIKPRLLILMETELWPNLLVICQERRIPVFIANARLSPLSSRRYAWLGGFMTWAIRSITGVAAQSHIDVERFRALGISSDKIWETGNIKFDLQLPPYLQEAGTELRKIIGQDRVIWVAASTHEGEEQIILNAYQQLKRDCPALLLVLVPRHPERFNKVAHLCAEQGLSWMKRSEQKRNQEPVSPDMEVFLGDTMGELLVFYAMADVAFVGGSFVPVGGHNMLEPAALGLPIVTGPQLFNFTAISELLVEAKGLTIVNTPAALISSVQTLLQDKTLRGEQGTRAKQVVEQNRGALDRLVKLIHQFGTVDNG